MNPHKRNSAFPIQSRALTPNSLYLYNIELGVAYSQPNRLKFFVDTQATKILNFLLKLKKISPRETSGPSDSLKQNEKVIFSYQINVKKTEPIRPNCFVGHHTTHIKFYIVGSKSIKNSGTDFIYSEVFEIHSPTKKYEKQIRQVYI